MATRRQAVTTRDIADQLDVSVSTVGRALAQDPRISTETRLRVEQKAAELGYVGNRVARMMRGAPSNVVGLLVPDIRNSFYSTAAHALAQSMAEQGYHVMLSETADNPDNELDQLRGMAATQVAGAILVPTPTPHTRTIELLRTLPHVQFLRHHEELGDDWFGLDDRATLRAATHHLRELGHDRIAYLGGPPSFSTSRRRLDGYLDIVPNGYADHLVAHVTPSSPDDARIALSQFLDDPNPPTAVVTSSVRVTEGVLQELTDRSIRVPDALSVVGFGDEPGFSWWGPGLTTMRLPVHEVATACSMWLLRHLSDDEAGAALSTSATGTLVLRGSTSAYGGAQ